MNLVNCIENHSTQMEPKNLNRKRVSCWLNDGFEIEKGGIWVGAVE